MRVGGLYSFNRGAEVISAQYPDELSQVYSVINTVDANIYKTKTSLEKSSTGRTFFHPASLNRAYSQLFIALGWKTHRVRCDYPTAFYTPDYTPKRSTRSAFREMDFVRDRVGVEVQFGKYAFMVYNVCAKMTIFRNEGVIDVGIEIVPLKELAEEMSSGVSYFEQFGWDRDWCGGSSREKGVVILGVTV